MVEWSFSVFEASETSQISETICKSWMAFQKDFEIRFWILEEKIKEFDHMHELRSASFISQEPCNSKN